MNHFILKHADIKAGFCDKHNKKKLKTYSHRVLINLFFFNSLIEGTGWRMRDRFHTSTHTHTPLKNHTRINLTPAQQKRTNAKKKNLSPVQICMLVYITKLVSGFHTLFLGLLVKVKNV